jgi:hypothetical protein
MPYGKLSRQWSDEYFLVQRLNLMPVAYGERNALKEPNSSAP